MSEKEIENKMVVGAHTHNIRDILGLSAEHDPQYATMVKTTIKPKQNRIWGFLKGK